ncbi:hypothetical protein VTI74DRAFT_9068 [Chaetomium olivicolor]
MEAREAAVGPSTQFVPSSIKRAIAAMLTRRDNECSPQPGVDLCEKPSISSTKATWIIVGAVLGALLVGTLAVLTFFHFRRQKRDKREDMEDRFQMSDYGLEETPGARPRRDEDVKWAGAAGGRRSRDPLHADVEPKYHTGTGGQGNGHLNPFDDATSVSGSSVAGSAVGGGQWPRKESSNKGSPLGQRS